MTRFRSIAPVFRVGDLAAAVTYYEHLGFTVNAEGEVRYARRDDITIHLTVGTGAAAAYAFVDDADALYAEWSALSLGGLLRPPTDTGAGTRAGSHTDPDGNQLTFAAYVGAQLTYVPKTKKAQSIEAKLGGLD